MTGEGQVEMLLCMSDISRYIQWLALYFHSVPVNTRTYFGSLYSLYLTLFSKEMSKKNGMPRITLLVKFSCKLLLLLPPSLCLQSNMSCWTCFYKFNFEPTFETRCTSFLSWSLYTSQPILWSSLDVCHLKPTSF